MAKCMCGDESCPCCAGHCEREAAVTLYRVDMEDATGTPMCGGCAEDAFESGLFVEQDEEDGQPCGTCGRQTDGDYPPLGECRQCGDECSGPLCLDCREAGCCVECGQL